MEGLVWTALLMGLAGGPHCAAMCGAPCAAISRVSGPGMSRSAWTYQAGRVMGYAAAGALAASAMQSLAWATSQATLLRPAWTLLHLAVLAWGLMLLALARQPQWVDGMARGAWGQLQPVLKRPGGPFVTGVIWALMPCSLLYSALLVAALTGGAVQGALAMGLFALGSALSLMLAPMLLLRLHAHANRWRQDWGTRLAGLALSGAAGWALWMDVSQRLGNSCT